MNKTTQQPAFIFNITAERVVIGALLQSETAFWAIAETLQAEHFYRVIHGRIFQAISDILHEGKKLTLNLLESRLGPEYAEGDDLKSTMALMTAYLRDSENQGSALDSVGDIVDTWRHRKIIETLKSSLKEAEKAGVNSYDLLDAIKTKVDDIGRQSQTEPIRTMGQIVTGVVTASKTANKTGKIGGFDTGLPELDEILGRIHPGDLGFIGAAPGDGKTVLGLQLAEQAQKYQPACFFQLEMKAEDMGRRALAGQTNLSVSEIEEGAYDFYAADELAAAAERLSKSQIYVDDRPKLRIDQIRTRAIALKRSKNLGLIVVDHLRLVNAAGNWRNKFDRIEHITMELKTLAKDLEIAVVVLSQITRMAQRRDDPTPQLNDFDGGSSIEQDADWALGLFRRDRWLKTQKPQNAEGKQFSEWLEQMQAAKGKIELTTVKRRRGEDRMMREFKFDGKRSLIVEIEK